MDAVRTGAILLLIAATSGGGNCWGPNGCGSPDADGRNNAGMPGPVRCWVPYDGVTGPVVRPRAPDYFFWFTNRSAMMHAAFDLEVPTLVPPPPTIAADDDDDDRGWRFPFGLFKRKTHDSDHRPVPYDFDETIGPDAPGELIESWEQTPTIGPPVQVKDAKRNGVGRNAGRDSSRRSRR